MGANLGRAAGRRAPRARPPPRPAALVGRHQLHDVGRRDPGHARDAAAVLEEAHRRLARVAARRSGTGRRHGRRRCRRDSASRCRRAPTADGPSTRSDGATPAPAPRPRCGAGCGGPGRSIRVVIGFGLVAVAVWVLSSKSRARRLHHVFKHVRLVVGRAGRRRRRSRSYVCFAAMQYELLKAGHLRAAVAAAVQAVLRVAGDHQLAARRQRRRVGLRLPLVPPLRRRQHAGRLGPGRHAGGRVVSLSLVAIIGLGLAANEGASLDLVPVLIGTFADHARPRLALRLRAPAPRGGAPACCGSRWR